MNQEKSKRSGGQEQARTARKGGLVEFPCKQDAQQLNDPCEEQVSLGSEDIGSLAGLEAECFFERRNGALHSGALSVNGCERRIIAGDTRVKAQVFVRIDVDATAIPGLGAGGRTAVDHCCSLRLRPWANEFQAWRTMRPAGKALENKRLIVQRAQRCAVFVEMRRGQGCVAWVEWDNNPLELAIFSQEAEVIKTVKGSVGGKSAVTQGRVKCAEVKQNGF